MGFEVLGSCFNVSRYLRTMVLLGPCIPSLRTLKFIEHTPGDVRQLFCSPDYFERRYCQTETPEFLKYIDLTEVDSSRQKALELAKTIISSTPFDLSKDLLFQMYVIRYSRSKYICFGKAAHIIIDGVGVLIIWKLLSLCYNHYWVFRVVLPVLKYMLPTVKDYIAVKKGGGGKEYWKKGLTNASFYFDFGAKYSPDNTGERLYFEIDASIITRMKKEMASTIFIVLISLYKSFLWRVYENNDICVVYPCNIRPKGLKYLTSFHINQLILRTIFDKDDSIIDVIKKVNARRLGDKKHKYYSYNVMCKEITGARNVNVCFMETMFSINNNVRFKNTQTKFIIIQGYGEVIYDLNLMYQVVKEKIMMCFEYKNSVFTKEFMENMVQNFKLFVENALKFKNKPIRDLEILDIQKRNLQLKQWNTKNDLKFDHSILVNEIFQNVVKKYPNNIACEFNDEKLSYKELNRRANKLANYLRKKYDINSPEVFIGVCVKKSIQLIISILAVMKAGGVYFPIYVNLPQERLKFMINDTKCSIIILNNAFKSKFDSIINNKEGLVGIEDEIYYKNRMDYNPNRLKSMTSNNLAYIIYTSGSTGKPKGVMIEHINLANFILAGFKHETQSFFSECKRSSLFCNICFDVHICEVFRPLCQGNALLIIPEDIRNDPQRLHDWHVSNLTDGLFFVPSMLKAIPRKRFRNSKVIEFCGEPCDYDTMKYWVSNVDKLVNSYGPTETTIYSLVKVWNNCETIDYSTNIGRPLYNYTCYILNKNLKVLPIGVPGELHIGGLSVARGYLNRPKLTKERFIINPYDNDERMYKTGDLCRYLSNGDVIFLGRVDFQVKVRGFRIELEEIETVLKMHSNVKDCVVLVKVDESFGWKKLVGYVILDDSSENSNRDHIQEFKVFLAKKLPNYMIPNIYVFLKNFPLNFSGKIDRKSLLKLEIDNSLLRKSEYAPPRNEIELKVASILSEILNIDDIGIYDNFFQLGGHSLLATILVFRIQNEFRVNFLLKDLFKNPTLIQMTSYINDLMNNYDGVLKDENSMMKKYDSKEVHYKIPLSYAQERLYFIESLSSESDLYIIPHVFRVRGDINVDFFERSINIMVNRHGILRTSFHCDENDVPYQQIINNDKFFQFRLFDKLSGSNLESFIENQLRNLNFILEEIFLFDGFIIRIDDETRIIVLTFHHIIFDMISSAIFFKELSHIYNSYMTEESSSVLNPVLYQYSDFSIWQKKEFLTEDVLKSQLSFWEDELKDFSPMIIDFPTDRPRSEKKTNDGKTLIVDIEKRYLEKVKEISVRNNVTLFISLFTFFQILIYKYNAQQKKFIIGIPFANRHYNGSENIIGFFVNVLPYPVDFSLKVNSFIDLIKVVKEKLFSIHNNQDIPFEKIVQNLNVQRSSSVNPIFQFYFSFFNRVDQKLNESLFLNGLDIEIINTKTSISKFDLDLTIFENESGLKLFFEYSTELFEKESIERLSEHYKKIIEVISENVDMNLDDVSLLTNKECYTQIHGWNISTFFVAYPIMKTVQESFEETVKLYPNNIAVQFKGSTITYEKLNKRVNQVADYLRRDIKILPEIFVGVCVERSIELVISILAVLKAGGVYFPIHHSLPNERINFLLEDTGCSVILCSSKFESTFCEFLDKDDDKKISVLKIEDLFRVTENSQSIDNLSIVNSSRNLAYVVYTSGSTGRPKGVLIEHKGIINTIYNRFKYFKLKAGDKFSQFMNISFDASISEILTPLFNGLTLLIFPEKDRFNPPRIYEILDSNNVNCFTATPSFLKLLPKKTINSLKTIIILGETCDYETMKYWASKVNVFANEYGPTEISVASHMKVWKDNDLPTNIGRTTSNFLQYILNEKREVLPVGIPGELCVGGIGVARGYLKRPKLNKERFIQNPFRLRERIYRTGDLCKYLSNGEVIFLGRVDFQVKIRGYRIELSEIEKVIISTCSADLVFECVVLARKNKDGILSLCGFVILKRPSDDQQQVSQEITKRIKKHLPGYMIPKYFVYLDSFPLNISGKVDRLKLVNLHRISAMVKPRDKIEEDLVKIWSEVLNVDRVSVNDNFFQLGGHSLLATRVATAIRNVFPVNFSIRDLFDNPTLLQMKLFIQDQINGDENVEKKVCIKKVADKEEFISLSYAQERLYFLDSLYSEGDLYIVNHSFKVKGDLDIEIMEKSINSIIERHEILRTSFVIFNKSPYQKVHDDWNKFKVIITDKFDKIMYSRFDLSTIPLFRCALVKSEGSDSILTFSFHHIIFDFVSSGIFFKELSRFYSSFKKNESPYLNKLLFQYSDFSIWQKSDYLKKNVIDKQLSFWKKFILDYPKVIDLPTDNPRNEKKSNSGNTLQFQLSKQILKAVKRLSLRNNVTLFVSFFSLYQVLLFKYCKQKKFIIGIPFANRHYNGSEHIIGFFVNVLPFPVDFSYENITFEEILQRTKSSIFEIYNNQDVPFDQIVQNFGMKRSNLIYQNPLFQVSFSFFDNYNRIKKDFLHFGDVEVIDDVFISSKISKFDLDMIIIEKNDCLNVYFEYSTDLFREATIRQYFTHFVTIINCLIIDMKTEFINEISLLSNYELEKQLNWNSASNQEQFSYEMTIPEMFELAVEKYPNKIAVEINDESITYQDFNNKINQLAYHLRNKYDIMPEMFVGVCVEKSIDMIISILAVIKSGGVYFPLDFELPQERLDFMLRDTDCSLVICQSKFKEKFIALSNVEEIDNFVFDEVKDFQNPSVVCDSRNLAYIIYTSGSTGKPKGVLIEHRNVVGFVTSQWKHLNLEVDTKYAQFSSILFDASISDLFTSLFYGLTLSVIPEDLRRKPVELFKYFEDHEINVCDIPPILLKSFPRRKSRSLQTIIIGGDTCDYETMDFWSRNVDYFINTYGPTETTVVSHLKKWNHNDLSTNIGKCLSNYYSLILNKDLKLLPIGFSGELCVGGVGVSRGYLNRPKLSKEKFIQNPYQGKQRIYKTGDLCKYLVSGDVIFLGRFDYQVKIRGFRIELEEIENTLRKHALVSDCVVLVEKAKSIIISFIILKNEIEKSESLEEELRLYLLLKLPYYMIPNSFVFINSFPVNLSGKVNREELLLSFGFDSLRKNDNVNSQPRNDSEKKLFKIFSEVLKLNQSTDFGIFHTFFELGGHSLLAPPLVSMIEQEFHVTLKLEELFQNPSVFQISSIIMNKKKDKSRKLVITKRNKKVNKIPLSFAQERLYFLNSIFKEVSVYMDVNVFKLKRSFFRLDIIEKSINQIIKNHEILRTSFMDLHQVVHCEYNFRFRVIKGNINLNKIVEDECSREFNLETLPLFRGVIIDNEKNKEEIVIILNFHHIIFDYVSSLIFFKELSEYYTSYVKNGNYVPVYNENLQYSDYAFWKRYVLLLPEVIAEQLLFWKKRLMKVTTDVAFLNVNSSKRSNSGAVKYFLISDHSNNDLVKKIRSMAIKNQSTLFIFIFTLFSILFYKYSGIDNFCIGVTFSNRHYKGSENIIGFFVNTLPFPFEFGVVRTFNELLDQVRKTFYDIYNNGQDIPFEKIVSSFGKSIERNTFKNPIFQTMFSFFNKYQSDVKNEFEDNFSLINNEDVSFTHTSKFDLDVDVVEVDDNELKIIFEYSTDVFNEKMIDELYVHFLKIANDVVNLGCQNIHELCLVGEEEVNKQLIEWNKHNIENMDFSSLTIGQMFKKVVKNNPTKIAAEINDEKISFEELDRKSDMIASYLIKNKVKPEMIVGVYLDKSIHLIASVIGVMKAGGVYLPLSTKTRELPSERLRYILNESKCSFVICESSKILSNCDNVMLIDEILLYNQAELNLDGLSISTRNLAYIVYTSGTTGNPKGVMIEQRSLINMVYSTYDGLKLTKDDKYALYSNLLFDVSISDIFVSLLNGLTLVIIPENIRRNPVEIFKYFECKKVSVAELPPTLVKEFPSKKIKHLRVLSISGEPCTDKNLLKFWSSSLDLVNSYGPTECCVTSHIKFIDPRNIEVNNIGRALLNYSSYILSSELQVMPISFLGELYIGGVGVARGYLNNDELTSQKFVTFPYDKTKRIYRTGDLCKYMKNGDIVFINRIRKNEQIKLDGFRIELKEIDNIIKTNFNKNSICLLDNIKNNINCYIVKKTDSVDNSQFVKKVKALLKLKLPYYMIPSYFFIIDRFPLNEINGKIDVRKLMLMKKESSLNRPLNDNEKKLVSVFQHVLGVDDVNIFDNFFQLGGNSLMIINLKLLIDKEFGIDLDINVLFNNSDIISLEEFVMNELDKFKIV